MTSGFMFKGKQLQFSDHQFMELSTLHNIYNESNKTVLL